MASPSPANPGRRRKAAKRRDFGRPKLASRRTSSGMTFVFSVLCLAAGTVLVYFVLQFHATYALGLQSPLKVQWQSPFIVARRADTLEANRAQSDQKHPLTAYQQYACRKFGSACRIALAIQRAENPQGRCELYHYNSNGTLDWGYFQINTVHLQAPGLVLRDLLDCRANIDFAYQLYSDHHGFTPWSTFNNGTYKRFLQD